MHIKIRDWEKHFERDRSRQWKNLQWVPIPNKQGKGYRLIMKQKNGLEIFACWIALVEIASACKIRGDLSSYNIQDLSLLTMIDEDKLRKAINFLSQSLDWIEVMKAEKKNLDRNDNNFDTHGMSNSFDSSILSYSILSDPNKKDNSIKKKGFIPPPFDEFKKYCTDNGFSGIAERAYKYYTEMKWKDSSGKQVKSWKGKLQAVWFKDENKDKKSTYTMKQNPWELYK